MSNSYRFAIPLLALAILLVAANDIKGYEFTVDLEDGYTHTIGWTDGLGNRLGQPLFEGPGHTGASVTRSTTNSAVEDHYHVMKSTVNNNTSYNDVHHGNSPLPTITDDFVIPGLFDPSSASSNIYYDIDLSEWTEISFSVGDSVVFTNGTSSGIPGYYVVEHSDPNLDITDVFIVNPATGERTLDPGSGAVEFSGVLYINGESTICGTCYTYHEIPTLTEWGLIIFSVLLVGWMTWMLIRRRQSVKIGI